VKIYPRKREFFKGFDSFFSHYYKRVSRPQAKKTTMPRTSQNTSRTKKDIVDTELLKPKKTITKKSSKTKAKQAAPQKTASKGSGRQRKTTKRIADMSHSEEMQFRQNKKANLAARIRLACINSSISVAPMLRLYKAIVVNTVGENVCVQLSAVTTLHNTVEDSVVKLIRRAMTYIPKGRQTLEVNHIYKALDTPSFKEEFRVIDARMDLKRIAPPKQRKTVEQS